MCEIREDLIRRGIMVVLCSKRYGGGAMFGEES